MRSHRQTGGGIDGAAGSATKASPEDTKAAIHSYSFLFMKADGTQLHAITSLIDSGIIRPVVDRVFPFESTKEALAYVEHIDVRRARSSSR